MTEIATITVTGMRCGGCEHNVTQKLTALAGVLSVKASHQDKQVVVEFDPTQTNLDEIEDTVVNAGYTVE